MELNAEQRRAVERSGQDVCVTAGPGSGKTRVLVERFAWLTEHGVRPVRILTITFTEKAANEIKQRLVARFREKPEVREEIERAYVSTIDGFCTRLLKENAIAAGIDPSFSILEDLMGPVVPVKVVDEVLEQLFAERPAEMRRLLDGLAVNDLDAALWKVYQGMRAAGVAAGSLPAASDPDLPSAVDQLRQAAAAAMGPVAKKDATAEQRALLETQRKWARGVMALPPDAAAGAYLAALAGFDCNLNKLKWAKPVYEDLRALKKDIIPAVQPRLVAAFYSAEQALLREVLARFDTEFRRRKREASLLDFADLEEVAVEVLRSNQALRARIQQSFDAVLMDELQDTNPLQWSLMDLIRRPDAFFAVGDINQSIFGFRHAEPEVFRGYRRALEEAGRAIDRLQLNHRSRPEILQLVTRVLGNAPGVEEFAFEAAGQFAPETEPSVEILAAYGEKTEAGAEIEAQWIARRIRELERDGTPFADIAVLIRTVSALDHLAPAFERWGVPYLQTRGRGFFEQREVLDLVYWLRAVRNPLDEISLLAVLRSPLVGVGDETILRLKRAGNLGEALEKLSDGAEFEPGDFERLRRFRDQLRWMQGAAGEVSPDRLLASAIDECNYLGGLTARARGNIEKFLAMVREAHTSRPRPLAELIEDLEALRESASEPDAPPVEARDAVEVLTIHGAKGLEFPVVFVAAMHQGPNRTPPAVGFAPGVGLGARWRDPATGANVSDPDHLAFSARQKEKEDREADRLLYVAMTRAKQHLALSFAVTDRAPANWAKQITEALELNLETFDNMAVDLDGVRLRRVDQAPPAWEEAGAAGAASAEPLELAAPEVRDSYDSAASATSIALFEACPRRYYLGRYIGWEEPLPDGRGSVAGALSASELGNQVHKLLAGETVENAAEEAVRLAERFLRSELGRRAERATRVEREFDFVMALEDVVINGQIDLWFEESGELVLVDYKTGREGPPLQLQIYALALERLTGRRPEEAWLYYPRGEKGVAVPLDEAAMNGARAAVRRFREAQSRLEFPLREGEQCRRCGFYRGRCPAGSGV
jgi:ATP-dependent helicase/nuclease subunit A